MKPDSLEGPSGVIEEEEAAIELLNILGAILCGSKVGSALIREIMHFFVLVLMVITFV